MPTLSATTALRSMSRSAPHCASATVATDRVGLVFFVACGVSRLARVPVVMDEPLVRTGYGPIEMSQRALQHVGSNGAAGPRGPVSRSCRFLQASRRQTPAGASTQGISLPRVRYLEEGFKGKAMKDLHVDHKKLIIVLLAAVPFVAFAHGFAGKRFFPATLATDDPFVSDELSLPTLTSSRTAAFGEDPSTRERSAAVDFAKRITPELGISLGTEYRRLTPEGESTHSGFGNLELGVKYQLYMNDAREALLAVGIGWEVGGSGSRQVGADQSGTFTPTLFYGKGFGDLPESVPYLKPLALTGTVGVAIPNRTSTTTTVIDPDSGELTSQVEQHPNVLQAGFAIQYSIPYLQSVVKDVGLPAPFDRMIPLVEVTLERPLNRVDDRRTTGTVSPGVLWAGRYVQLGLEAVIPLNNRSGQGVGARAQLHFFLDDLFPTGIGRPIFER
jgi:hypothetical protein